MANSRQLAKAQVGVYEFRVIRMTEGGIFRLYRTWHEFSQGRMHERKHLDGTFEFYHDALKTIAYYQEYYYHYCRVPTLEQISV
jgi:hypothetical protein